MDALRSPSVGWIGTQDFDKGTADCEILAITEAPGKFANKPDTILTFNLENSNVGRVTRQMSLYGYNYVMLYNAFGSTPSSWIGRKFRLEEQVGDDGKKRRVVTHIL